MHGARDAPPPGGRRRLRVAVLASGAGTLLQALLDAAGTDPPFEVVLVASDRDGAPALDRARRAGLPVRVVAPRDHEDRGAWDLALARELERHDPQLLVLAGFMRLLGPAALHRWPGAILNSHPSMLPAFPGARAVEEALQSGAAVTGASVIAVDDGMDTGPVLAQRPVPVLPGDTVETLHERIKAVERPLLLEVLAAVATAMLAADPTPPPAAIATPPRPSKELHR